MNLEIHFKGGTDAVSHTDAFRLDVLLIVLPMFLMLGFVFVSYSFCIFLSLLGWPTC